MPKFQFTQQIGQLEKRKGGYFYLKIDAETVEQFEKKRATRLKCNLDNQLEYSCGLNHFGDGNFFIIIATKYLKKIKKSLGDEIYFEIYEDPNPLGVEIPESLQVLLEQDENAKHNFNQLTDGKKRSLIYSINKLKNIDLQIERSLDFLYNEVSKKTKKAERNKG